MSTNLHPLPSGSSRRCPGCGEPTDSLKTYEFPRLTFYGFGASYHIERITACPSCLRLYLLQWASLAGITANLAWPVVIFPLLVSRLFASFLPGHYTGAKSILKKLASGVLGLLLVVAAFALAIGIVGMFGPIPHTFANIAMGAGFATVILGLLAALAGL